MWRKRPLILFPKSSKFGQESFHGVGFVNSVKGAGRGVRCCSEKDLAGWVLPPAARDTAGVKETASDRNAAVSALVKLALIAADINDTGLATLLAAGVRVTLGLDLP